MAQAAGVREREPALKLLQGMARPAQLRELSCARAPHCCSPFLCRLYLALLLTAAMMPPAQLRGLCSWHTVAHPLLRCPLPPQLHRLGSCRTATPTSVLLPATCHSGASWAHATVPLIAGVCTSHLLQHSATCHLRSCASWAPRAPATMCCLQSSGRSRTSSGGPTRSRWTR